MEGLLFLWFSWSLWVCLSFLLPKKFPERLKYSALILLLIIASNFNVFLGPYEVYLSSLIILVTVYWSTNGEKLRMKLSLFFNSFIISLAFSAFRMFEIFDPVWLVFKREWMLGIVLCYLSMLLQNSLKGRVLILLSGAVQGEILTAVFLRHVSIYESIGSPGFLDVCTVSCFLLLAWSGISRTGSFAGQLSLFKEKENHKSS